MFLGVKGNPLLVQMLVRYSPESSVSTTQINNKQLSFSLVVDIMSDPWFRAPSCAIQTHRITKMQMISATSPLKTLFSLLLSSELDEEAQALQALLSAISKPVVSIHSRPLPLSFILPQLYSFRTNCMILCGH